MTAAVDSVLQVKKLQVTGQLQVNVAMKPGGFSEKKRKRNHYTVQNLQLEA